VDFHLSNWVCTKMCALLNVGWVSTNDVVSVLVASQLLAEIRALLSRLCLDRNPGVRRILHRVQTQTRPCRIFITRPSKRVFPSTKWRNSVGMRVKKIIPWLCLAAISVTGLSSAQVNKSDDKSDVTARIAKTLQARLPRVHIEKVQPSQWPYL